MTTRRIFAFIACFAVLGCKPSQKSGKSYEDYPEFQEGGSMTLTVDSEPHDLRLTDIQFANTDEGYPDYIEVNGNGTRLIFECTKDYNLDFDSEAPYQPIINQPLPIGNLGIDDEKMTIQIPNVDTFDVVSGTLTLQKFTIGRDGRDWWDGNISLTLDAADGPLTVTGPFSWCIVPVW